MYCTISPPVAPEPNDVGADHEPGIGIAALLVTSANAGMAIMPTTAKPSKARFIFQSSTRLPSFTGIPKIAAEATFNVEQDNLRGIELANGAELDSRLT
jgi:hypothetical protein